MSNDLTTPDETLYKLIASQIITGVSKSAIAKQLNTNVQRINNLLKDEQFKSILAELTEDVVSTAVAATKGALTERVEQSLKVIDHHLANNNLDAVKLLFKSLGIENVTTQVAQQGSLTVVLPNFDETKTIEIPSTGKK